jgi:ABC-type phosphate transport system substrate-binding protein
MLISDSKLSANDAEKINAILSKNFPGTTVQVAASGSVAIANTCTDVCNAAQAVAEAACEGLGGGIATAVCKIAARAAGDECRRHC